MTDQCQAEADAMAARVRHLYEGDPDARQAGGIKPSRFRPQYRALSDAEKALHDAIKGKAAELEALFERARALRTPVLEPIVAGPFTEEERLLLEAELNTVGSAVSSALVCGATLSFDTNYFGEGMKSLELAVMWTVKGLTA